MGIKIWRDDGHYASLASSSVECLKNDNAQVVLYTLQNKETITAVPDEYSVTSILMVLEGALRVHASDKLEDVQTHDMLMLTDIDESYCIEAVGFTKLLAVTTEANQDPQEDAAISAMLMEVEEKDVYTLGHSRRVSLYSKRLALAYQSTYNIMSLGAAACMHDIGKINTPIEILQKPGRLTTEEFDIIKLHPGDSYTILRDKLGERVAQAAKQHHERLDGSGYPDGLRGDKIGMDARIIAIADVFDAMTCKRIYNNPTPPLEVVKMLEESPDKYDADIVAVLRKKVEKGELDDILTAFVVS